MACDDTVNPLQTVQSTVLHYTFTSMSNTACSTATLVGETTHVTLFVVSHRVKL